MEKPKITTSDFFRRLALSFVKQDATDATALMQEIRVATTDRLQAHQDASDRDRGGIIDAHGVEK
jgi:hypothetical protein